MLTTEKTTQQQRTLMPKSLTIIQPVDFPLDLTLENDIKMDTLPNHAQNSFPY